MVWSICVFLLGFSPESCTFQFWCFTNIIWMCKRSITGFSSKHIANISFQNNWNSRCWWLSLMNEILKGIIESEWCWAEPVALYLKHSFKSISESEPLQRSFNYKSQVKSQFEVNQWLLFPDKKNQPAKWSNDWLQALLELSINDRQHPSFIRGFRVLSKLCECINVTANGYFNLGFWETSSKWNKDQETKTRKV